MYALLLWIDLEVEDLVSLRPYEESRSGSLSPACFTVIVYHHSLAAG